MWTVRPTIKDCFNLCLHIELQTHTQTAQAAAPCSGRLTSHQAVKQAPGMHWLLKLLPSDSQTPVSVKSLKLPLMLEQSVHVRT